MSTFAGIILKSSPFTVKVSIERLVKILSEKKFTIYTKIDQQDELKKAGFTINPLEYILFGSPRLGGQLMLENPLVALDLPLKIIAFADNERKVWLAYNDPAYIKERYNLQPTPNSGPNMDDLVELVINPEK